MLDVLSGLVIGTAPADNVLLLGTVGVYPVKTVGEAGDGDDRVYEST